MDKLSVCRILLPQRKPKLGRTKLLTGTHAVHGPRVGHSCYMVTVQSCFSRVISPGELYCYWFNAPNYHLSHVLASVVQGDVVNCNNKHHHVCSWSFFTCKIYLYSKESTGKTVCKTSANILIKKIQKSYFGKKMFRLFASIYLCVRMSQCWISIKQTTFLGCW